MIRTESNIMDIYIQQNIIYYVYNTTEHNKRIKQNRIVKQDSRVEQNGTEHSTAWHTETCTVQCETKATAGLENVIYEQNLWWLCFVFLRFV